MRRARRAPASTIGLSSAQTDGDVMGGIVTRKGFVPRPGSCAQDAEVRCSTRPLSRTLFEQSRFVRVMRPAAQLKILNIRRAARSERHDMMELEKAELSAPALSTDERASPAVTRPNRPLDGSGHMARR